MITKYLRQIAIFLIPLLIFFMFIELVERRIPNDFKYKSAYLDSNASKLEILVLGSSHSMSFIQPDQFKSEAFNAANLHQTLKFDQFIFHKYSERMKNLKVVIIPISYGTYFSSLEDSKDNWRIKDYKLYFGYTNSNFLSGRLEVTNGSTNVQFMECIDFLTEGKDKITCSRKGFGIKFSKDPQTDLEKTGKLVAKRHTRECDKKHIEENVQALKAIIANCEKKNIRVFLYTAPAWHTYRESLAPEFMKEMKGITQDIVRSYSNVTYRDYMDDKRFKIEHFRDVDHLNEKGANYFTEIIKLELGLE